jgi:photosystem II stability/assembly factor-like uncharacterized protein
LLKTAYFPAIEGWTIRSAELRGFFPKELSGMRVTPVIAMATLALGLVPRPMLAQGRVDIPALESIHMFDALIGWAVTHDQNASFGSPTNGLVRTTDGGTNWRDVTPQTRFYLNANSVDVLTSLFAWVGQFRTVDGGRTWKQTPTPLARSIHFINPRDGWLLAFQGANNRSVETDVYRSTDGGESWVRVASSRFGAADKTDLPDVVGGDPHITFLNTTTGWITRSDPVDLFEWKYLHVTRDGGRTWTQQRLPLPSQLTSSWGSGILPPKFFTTQDGTLPVFYTNLVSDHPIASFAVIYVTRDGGTTWKYSTPVSVANQTRRIDNYGRAMWGMNFVDINHGWMSDGSVLYATVDGGRQWMALRPASFTDIRQVDFVSTQVGWAVRHAPPFLLKTLDGGRTWSPVTYTISRE